MVSDFQEDCKIHVKNDRLGIMVMGLRCKSMAATLSYNHMHKFYKMGWTEVVFALTNRLVITPAVLAKVKACSMAVLNDNTMHRALPQQQPLEAFCFLPSLLPCSASSCPFFSAGKEVADGGWAAKTPAGKLGHQGNRSKEVPCSEKKSVEIILGWSGDSYWNQQHD